jgi:hypothetical protein
MAGRKEELLSMDAEANARLTGGAQDGADSAHTRTDNRSARTGSFGCR